VTGRISICSDPIGLKSGLPKPHEIPQPKSVEVNTPALEPTSKTPWLKYAAISAGLTMIVLWNIFFFSLMVLLTSVVLVGCFIYPIIKEHFTSKPVIIQPQNLQNNDTSSKEEPAAPILLLTRTQQALSPEPIDPVPNDPSPMKINKPTNLTGYGLHSLFAPQKKNDTLPMNCMDPHELGDTTNLSPIKIFADQFRHNLGSNL